MTERIAMPQPLNLEEAFERIDGYWQPRIGAELNDSYVKLARLKGEFIWHHHDDEDELFYVFKGRLLMQLRDGDVWVEQGEMIVIPRGVEHRPVAPDEVQVMLIEPRSTVNTGNVEGDRTVEDAWL
jgi:mannose-6-phosphate isomerase-like protein (cupin superfamily)